MVEISLLNHQLPTPGRQKRKTLIFFDKNFFTRSFLCLEFFLGENLHIILYAIKINLLHKNSIISTYNTYMYRIHPRFYKKKLPRRRLATTSGVDRVRSTDEHRDKRHRDVTCTQEELSPHCHTGDQSESVQKQNIGTTMFENYPYYRQNNKETILKYYLHRKLDTKLLPMRKNSAWYYFFPRRYLFFPFRPNRKFLSDMSICLDIKFRINFFVEKNFGSFIICLNY